MLWVWSHCFLDLIRILMKFDWLPQDGGLLSQVIVQFERGDGVPVEVNQYMNAFLMDSSCAVGLTLC